MIKKEIEKISRDYLAGKWFEYSQKDLDEVCKLLRTVAAEARKEGRKEGIEEALKAITKTEHAEFRPDTIYIDLAEAAEAITRLKEKRND